MKHCLTIDSPEGPLTLVAKAGALCALRFSGSTAEDGCPAAADTVDGEVLEEARRQLTAYFAGRRQQFDLPLRPAGTPFQQQVWAALQTIPYGATRTYGAVAAQIGRPKASRAVGMANHVNPLPIVIPCHRVIGATGRLTGYAGGLERKERLLALERQPTV